MHSTLADLFDVLRTDNIDRGVIGDWPKKRADPVRKSALAPLGPFGTVKNTTQEIDSPFYWISRCLKLMQNTYHNICNDFYE